MHNAIQKTIQFISQLKLEQIYNIVVLSIICIIVVLASIALYRPIGVPQFHNVAASFATIHVCQHARYGGCFTAINRPIRYVHYLKVDAGSSGRERSGTDSFLHWCRNSIFILIGSNIRGIRCIRRLDWGCRWFGKSRCSQILF